MVVTPSYLYNEIPYTWKGGLHIVTTPWNIVTHIYLYLQKVIYIYMQIMEIQHFDNVSLLRLK